MRVRGMEERQVQGHQLFCQAGPRPDGALGRAAQGLHPQGAGEVRSRRLCLRRPCLGAGAFRISKEISVTSQAISPELREWVVTQLAAGHSIPSLRASMRDAGWHADAAEAALAEVEAQAAGLATIPVARTSMPGPDLSNAPLYIDAGDRRVQVLQTLRHPRVVVFGDLLSDDECEGLIQTARQRLARSLTVETQTGGEALNVDRTSDGMFFERGENPIVARLEQR